MTENKYQSDLIKKLKKMFPGCVILRNDPQYQQGMLDLTILWNDHWGSLEVKANSTSDLQPNQQHYLDRLGEMSFAAIIYPEIEEEVLSALQKAFEPPRRARVP
jgi:hypothetical protein